MPLMAAHLRRCASCAADHADLSAALTAFANDTLPEPYRYPAPDTSFLPLPAPGVPLLERMLGALGLGAAGSPAGTNLARLAVGIAVVVLALAGLAFLNRGGAPATPPREAEAPGTSATLVATTPAQQAGPESSAAAATTAQAQATAAATAPTAAAPGTVHTAGGTPALSPATPPRPTPPPTSEAPAPAAIALIDPALEDSSSGLLRFRWTTRQSLAAGTVFDVRVCDGANCQPSTGKTNVTDSTWVWCPDAGAGAYRWQVAVIDNASKQQVGPASAVGGFGWLGGSCAEPRTTPLGPPPATPGEPPPEP
jgi:hypothetical protein